MIEILIHSGIGAAVIVVVLGVGGKITAKLDRLLNVSIDFPPHRHVNGNISYPKGYEPPEIEHTMTVKVGMD